MTEFSGNLTFKKIFLFWIPLSATWLMMSFEGPFLAALIARLPEPKYNLAAYGVAFSFALMIEAPVILLMSASTALVKDKQSFFKLRNFTYGLNIIVTIAILLLVIPSVFYFVAVDLVSLPQEVARLTHIAVIILIPWPGAIGYRRFYQGILIRNNLTKRVAYGTIIRLSSMAVTATSLFLFTEVEGVIVGASALSAAVVCEAAASKFMTFQIIKKLKAGGITSDEPINLTYKNIFRFYYPLALTSMITLGVQPMVTFFIGQSSMALESLAVLPVINSFVFIFRSFGLSFQEAAIALIGQKKEGYNILKKYAFTMGIIVVAALGIIAFSPLADFWFHTISGLSNNLTSFAKTPLIIMIFMPGLSVLLSFQTAVLVDARNTKPITFSTLTEFFGIVIIVFIMTNVFPFVGVIAATTGFILGRLGANLYLTPPFLKTVKDYPA